MTVSIIELDGRVEEKEEARNKDRFKKKEADKNKGRTEEAGMLCL